MKKQLLTLLPLAIVSIVIGLLLRWWQDSSKPPIEPLFDCPTLAVPSADYTVLRVNPDQSLTTLKGSETFSLGRLKPQADGPFLLELSTETIHSAGDSLDPLSTYHLEQSPAGVTIVGVRQGAETVRHNCTVKVTLNR
ncbi:MAG: hypothetical protein AB7F86_13675 [Bdellovibrionales bacterium]